MSSANHSSISGANTGGQELGKNVAARLEGTKLILEIDLTRSYGLSSSGKSTIIATTSGNVLVPGTNARLGLNLYQ